MLKRLFINLINKNDIKPIAPSIPEFTLNHEQKLLINGSGNTHSILPASDSKPLQIDSEFRRKVVELKHRTGRGLIECMKALSEADRDFNKATLILINKGVIEPI